ncbi:GNAT family N-acetyltransferase [Rhodanobacter terrae]|uniref:GNAT family N-acetyltransferase n=1 Tax=Rhodanobacter terrae TaxID=418647 RepID=A0ABW0SVS5_9GAMM
MLDLQPTLAGTNLVLRPMTAEDHGALFAIASDPLLWAQHPDPSRSTLEGFDQFFHAALQSKGCLVAIDSDRKAVIGCTRYHSYVPGLRVIIGYTFLSRSYWGGATNGEMKRLMLQHAFTDVSEVLFLVAEGNARSRRAVEKLGAELAGAEDTPRFGQIHLAYRLTPQAQAQAIDRTHLTTRPGTDIGSVAA